MASTLASFHLRAPRAVSASVHKAARTPSTLLAAIETPVPVQQHTIPPVGLSLGDVLGDSTTGVGPRKGRGHGLDVVALLREIRDDVVGQRRYLICAECNLHGCHRRTTS